MSVEIKKVETKKDLKHFIELHYELYNGNEYDAPNLFMDEKNTFSQETMIKLQSQTTKRDQAYDMISNVLKSFSTVMTATVNNV